MKGKSMIVATNGDKNDGIYTQFLTQFSPQLETKGSIDNTKGKPTIVARIEKLKILGY